MAAAIIHTSETDIYVPVLSRFHPFDGRKFSRAWARLASQLPGARPKHHGLSDAEIEGAIAAALSPQLIASLRTSAVVAKAVGAGALRFLPNSLLQRRILRPMRVAVGGTVVAAREALTRGVMFNFGGGFHHAFRDRAEGFCVYNDVAVAVEYLRSRSLIPRDAPLWLIDLDAHRGNGNEGCFWDDPTMHVLDVYNEQAYPGPMVGGESRYPFLVGIAPGTGTESYLRLLQAKLAAFMQASPTPAVAFYNAGTDIVAGDPLGRQNVSEDGVFERDRYVIETLRSRGIPTVVLPAGGYAEASHRLIARTAEWILRTVGGQPAA